MSIILSRELLIILLTRLTVLNSTVVVFRFNFGFLAAFYIIDFVLRIISLFYLGELVPWHDSIINWIFLEFLSLIITQSLIRKVN